MLPWGQWTGQVLHKGLLLLLGCTFSPLVLLAVAPTLLLKDTPSGSALNTTAQEHAVEVKSIPLLLIKGILDHLIHIHYLYMKRVGNHQEVTLLDGWHHQEPCTMYIQWGKKVFSQPIVQVLPLKKMRKACNFHHRYTSTMTDKMRKKNPENHIVGFLMNLFANYGGK